METELHCEELDVQKAMLDCIMVCIFSLSCLRCMRPLCPRPGLHGLGFL